MKNKILLFGLILLSMGFAAHVALAGTATVSWNANTESDLSGYKIYYGTASRTGSCPPGGYPNIKDVGNVTSYTFSNLTNGNTYYFSITAYDTSHNESCFSAEVSKNLSTSGDTTPPSTPTGLSGSAISSSQINLSWTASTDNVGVTGYKIYRNGSQVATTAITSYADTGLSAHTAYTYTVSAYDAAGNNSNKSASASVTTSNAPPAPITGSLSVSITSPSNNNFFHQSDNVTISANVTDSASILGVQFQAGGQNIGSEVTVAPYKKVWSVPSLSPGTYTYVLTAVARDSAGVTVTSAPVTVFVSGSGTVTNTTNTTNTTTNTTNTTTNTTTTTNQNQTNQNVFPALHGPFGYNLSSPEVQILQQMLKVDGDLNQNVELSNHYGPLTRAAVNAFQGKYSISPVSGTAGPLTRGKLNQLFAQTSMTTNSNGLTRADIENQIKYLQQQVLILLQQLYQILQQQQPSS